MSLTDGSGLSAADVAAVTGNNGFGGFGGDGAWWLLVLFLFAFNGNWGNNGWGGNGNGGATYVVSDVQRGFDQNAIMSGLSGIQSSLTSGFVDTASALCNGFAGVNGAIANGFAQSEIAANARQMADMQQSFGLQSQLAQCCCDNRLASADLKYTIATENCADRTALADSVRDILESQNAGVQRILDTMCQDKIDAKNERIVSLENQLNMAQLAASQTAQTARLLADNANQTQQIENYVRPQINPAYIVPNPYAYNFNPYGGWNNSFGGCCNGGFNGVA